MKDARTPEDEQPSVQDVLDALSDPDCRAILQQTIEPMTANELIDACEISKSTLYRKLDVLTAASLLKKRETISLNGGRVTRYECSFGDVNISLNEAGEFSVGIKRPSRATDERLADIWSIMGDEL
ncbi:helix-turn-helix domain-containing protein [Halovenus halobia]|uniref:helix-turn-helix domain-containing protein n=1 Tax=Halovenus halobia TaxID=3396622 RepID=UPI003F549646